VITHSSFALSPWIRQDSKLVDSSYSLTVAEMRLVWHLIAMVQPGDIDFSEYEFSTSELGKMMGNSDLTHAEAEAIVLRLWRREIHVAHGSKKLALRWICEAARDAKRGTIRVSISPTMRPYLLQLKEWTQAKLEQLCSLSSRYAVRFYLWACKIRNQKQRDWIFSIEELRDSLEIPHAEYARFYDFNLWVLRKPIAEVNSRTDLKLDYQVLRRSRVPYAIRFVLVEGEPTSTRTGKLVHVEKSKRIKQRNRTIHRQKVSDLYTLPDYKEMTQEEHALGIEQLRRVKQEIYAKSSAN
jgi:plasmid replication initiation protein